MSSLLEKKPRLVRSFIIIYVVLQTCFNLGLLLSAKIYIIPFYEASIVQRLRDACLCMGDLQAPPAPHFVFLITL